MRNALVSVVAISLGGVALAAADWPQWQGPDRTRISHETGLLKEWPTGGPRVIWTANNLGTGYGSMSVAGDRVFVQGARGQNSFVIALNRADGKEVWAKALGPIETRMRTNMGAGPRGTPTVDGDRLYVLTENGDLACLKTDGSSVWQLNILKEFGGSQLQWMISESPLVDGPHVVVSPGGPGAGIVKLDKMTGKTIWTSKELSDTAGYSSITAGDVQGVRTYMTFTAQAGVGVRASDGKLMFRYTKAANNVANIATPVFLNDKVFFTSGYGAGAGLLALTAKNGEVAATEVYHTPDMRNHHGGVVVVDGYLYGFSDLILTCLEFATGKVMWRDRSVGKGSVTYADGHLYIQSENNIARRFVAGCRMRLMSVAPLFAKSAPEVQLTYRRILEVARAFGPVAEEPRKTSIHLVARTAFAGVATRRSALILTLKSSRDIRSPRVEKREQVSAHRWHVEIRLAKPSDVDRQLTTWIGAAYKLANGDKRRSTLGTRV